MSSWEKTLERETEKSDRELPDEVASTIAKFIEDMSLDISTSRLYSYAFRLRIIAGMIPEKFLKPSEDDLRGVIRRIKARKVTWGSGQPHPPTENSIQMYLVSMKKFYTWMNHSEVPDNVKWIKLGTVRASRQVEPESLITKEEVNELIQACENPRDKAIFSALYDSGIRLGELLNMRINSVSFDQYGAVLNVPKGKTGFRRVRVVGDSIPYLRAWLEVHPKKNPSAPLFCNLSEDIRGRALTSADVYSIIRKVKRRAGITRRIHPHLFRHTRATILASRVTEAPLEAQMGWVHGSKQTRTYVHLSGRDQDNAILKAYGIEIKDVGKIEEERPRECPRCHQLSPGNSKYCLTCGLPLDVKTAIEWDEKIKQIEDAIMNSTVIPPEMKEFINGFKPEDRDKVYTATLKWVEASKEREERLVEEAVERVLARRTEEKNRS